MGRFSCLAWSNPAWGSVGSMVELIVTSKRAYDKGNISGLLLPMPHPCGESLLTRASTGDPPILTGSFGSVFYGVTAPFLWVFVHTRFCLCPSRLESHFPQSCGSPIIISHWTSRSDSLTIPSALSDLQAGKSDVRLRNFTTVGELLWYYCSPVCGVTHPEDMGFDCIMIVPLLPSLCGFFFVFGCRESFFDGFQCSPADGCSTASCNFGALAGGDECVSLYSTTLN